ncbi:MAG: ABC transporter ATP-binding protein [Mesorhizobium sp.]|nr:MAG: ABC transporter ATP-binding protein [Mesorhizobium sp.]TIO51936.1 MAG: ABC transporter ATP-binding protein [Mesorhizobium sp.]TIO58096.1 MAG: ABC transporter ATP-binding protein [Mesorhizobium sp.]TJV59095.1 MAG: ABC transporter ATP-binding protein [Mesorhizobium sp.]
MLRQALGRRQLGLLPAVVALGLASAALEGFGIGLIIPLLGIIMGHGEATGMAGLSALLQKVGAGLGERERLIAISAAILGSILFKNLLAFANSVLTAHIYGKASQTIRGALAERLLTVGYPFFLRESPGRLLNIISNESWRASDAIQGMLGAIVSASAAAILLAFLLLLSWQMTLLVMLGLALVQAAHMALSAHLRAPSRGVAARNSALASRMLHLVHAGRLIRIFGQEAREKAAFEKASDGVRRAAFLLSNRQGALAPLTEVLHAVLFLAVVIGAWLAGLSFPLVAAFLILLYRLQPHVRALQMTWSQLQGLSGSLEEVTWLLDPAGKPTPPRGSRPFDGLGEKIAFEGVSFSYANEEQRAAVLNAASFDIVSGRSTALIGRSGAGKTTIVNLLCRFVEPDGGKILVDGAPLGDIDPVAWRTRIALASQELELVDGTILDNITYGKDTASAEEARRAAELAEAHAFIETLPQGYDTIVGYRGVNLSAGQRQRIALARALLRDPDILILDEATNAVDGLSEAAIVETLKSRAGRRTTIVISHHHSTISFCDDLVILEHGRVRKQAPFAEMAKLSMDELYRPE